MEVYGMLLQERMHVYVSLTYTGHDCIVKSEAGRHVDIEIKTRSPGAHPYYLVDNFKVRDDFFVICHTLTTQDFWVLPSSVYEKHSTSQQGGRMLVLSGTKRKELNQYDRAFFLLRDFGRKEKGDRKVRHRPSMRSEIAKLILAGLPDGEIAKKLGVRPGSAYVVRRIKGPDRRYSSGRNRTKEELDVIAKST